MWRDRFWRIAAVLALVRIGMALALRHGLPPAAHDGWMFETGGDEEAYLELASALAHGQLIHSAFALGYPLLLVPAIWLTRATTVAELAPIIVQLQAFVFAPLCVFAVAWIGRRMTGSRAAGLLAAGLWTLLPYLIWGTLIWMRSCYPELRRGFEPGRQLACLLGVQMIADTLSTALIIASVWRLCRALDAPAGPRFLAAGLFAGWAMLVRTSNAAIAGLGCAMLLSRREWRGLAVFLAAAGAVMGFQLWYNAVVEGSPLQFGWIPFERDYMASHRDAGAYPYPYPAVFSLTNVRYCADWLMRRLPPAAPALLMSVTAACAAGAALLARQARRQEALWLALWCAAYAAVMLPYYGFPGGIIRYLMPVYPPACIAIAVAIHRLAVRPAPPCSQ